MGLFHSVYDVILDRTAAELLGAIGVAIALSFAVSGFFALLRGKVGDHVLLVVVLLIIASVASMGLGAGFVASAKAGGPRPRPDGAERFLSRPSRWPGLAGRVIEMADANGDGRLSPEEASGAAGRFVAEQARAGSAPVDAESLARAIGERGGPSYAHPMEGPVPGVSMADRLIIAADEDRDGRLTPDEAARFFRAADEDADGAIDHREIFVRLRRGFPSPSVDHVLPQVQQLPAQGSGPETRDTSRAGAADLRRPPGAIGRRP